MFDLRFALPLCFLITQAAEGATTQWADLTGMITGRVAVAKNSDGRLEAFARWQDNTLWHTYQTTAGGAQWSSWSGLGGVLASNPAVAVNADGTLDVFALGADNAIWHTRQTSAGGAAWSTWTSLGGQGQNDPAVGVNTDGRLEVFFETTTDSMWHMWQLAAGGSWSAGDEIVGNLVQSPSVAGNSDGRLIVFTGDTDGKYWWTIQNTAGQDSWSSWWCLLGGTVSAPVFGTNADGSLQLFAVRADSSVWTAAQTPTGSYTWSDWISLGTGTMSSVAVARNADGRLEVFGLGTDNALWHSWQISPGGAWSDWARLGNVLANAPTAVADANGLLQVFAEGNDSGLWNIGQSSAGVWVGPATAPTISSTNAAIPVWRGASSFSSNMYVTIYGSNLSTATQSWTGAFTGSAAPTTLGGVSVTVDGIQAFIQYVSPTQINIDAPDDTATGPVNIVVTNSSGSSNTGTATRALISPTLLSDPRFSASSTYYVVAQTPDFSTFIGPPNLVQGSSFAAANPGDTVIVFATGCGPTNPPTQAGVLATQNSPLALPYQVTIGGIPANVAFAGVVQGTVGLYQFNIAIPNVAAGDQPIALSVNGVPNAQNLMITVGQ